MYAGVEGIGQVEDIFGGGLSWSFQVEEVTEDIFQKSQVAEVQEAGEDLAADEASRADWDHIVMDFSWSQWRKSFCPGSNLQVKLDCLN